MSKDEIIFGATEIARRVKILARAIAQNPNPPEIAVPVLMGAFVFAADLMRALSDEGLSLGTEFVWLRSYGADDRPGEIEILRAPTQAVTGKSVLLIDGILESGATLFRAHALLKEADARSISSAVAVVKKHPNPQFVADHAAFEAGEEFLFGYGTDAGGADRGLPDIWVRR